MNKEKTKFSMGEIIGITVGFLAFIIVLATVSYTSIDLTVKAINSSSVNLSWKDSKEEATVFEMYRSLDNSSWKTATLVDKLPSNLFECTDTNLNPSTTYYYRIRGVKDSGEDYWSNTDSATTPELEPCPVCQHRVNDECVVREDGYNDCGEGCQRCVDGSCQDYDQICSERQHCESDSCVCNEGYVRRDDECLSSTEVCTETCIREHGPHVYGVENDKDTSMCDCYCEDGYEWEFSPPVSSNKCIRSTSCEGTDISCGHPGKCINCNEKDGCIGGNYYDYYCEDNSCEVNVTYNSENCIICSSCQYFSEGACYNYCQGTDADCGCTSCVNCNDKDSCYGDIFRDYYCVNNSCIVRTSDNCSDCSCNCGGYNIAESIANGNCNDEIDNDCDGNIDSLDFGCIKSEKPRTVTFSWKYKDRFYSLTTTFYKSIYEYYDSKSDEYANSWNYYLITTENYFTKLLEIPEEDKTISQIASEIKSKGKRSGLTDDEIVELAIVFVQTIPYDELKASEIDAILPESSFNPDLMTESPYETLYDKKGVCGDKALLAASLVRELDYGVSILDYEEEQHVALGIECPSHYSSYDSNYCYTEVTETGWLIGEDIIEDTLKKILRESIGIKNPEDYGYWPQSKPKIYPIEDGKTYKKIIDTIRLVEKIESLHKEIEGLETELLSLEVELKNYEQRLDLLERIGNWDAYEKLYSEYEKVYSSYEQKTKDYNNKVKLYNNALDELEW